jgi:rRNA maturation endonuclease Nob1
MKKSLNTKFVNFMQSSKLQSSNKFMQPCHNVETDFVGGGGAKI